jgi:hypothetical protein
MQFEGGKPPDSPHRAPHIKDERWRSAGLGFEPGRAGAWLSLTFSQDDKYRAHAGHLHPGQTFVPANVETYGYLGRPIMQYLYTLSDVALARSLAVTQGSFLASTHLELSVALVQSQGYVYSFCALLLAKASRRPVLLGADTPFLD